METISAIVTALLYNFEKPFVRMPELPLIAIIALVLGIGESIRNYYIYRTDPARFFPDGWKQRFIVRGAVVVGALALLIFWIVVLYKTPSDIVDGSY
ncbi:MAG: hypothetical protein NUW37_09760 [Planctomycetes bacterium]|nr:hypothetical protein [Planctomycetota bacterium]